MIFQATVLEEMPPFPERESSILAKLKKKKGPGAVSVTDLEDNKREGGELNGGGDRGPDTSAMAASNAVSILSVVVLLLITKILTLKKRFRFKFHVFSSPHHHHQQTCLGFVQLHPLVPLQPALAAYWWMCSLRQGLQHHLRL